MFIEKNHRVKIEDAEKGCFLRVTLKGKQTEIGRPKASRAVCIYRCNACFTDAIALDSFDCIPSKTLFVLSEYEGVYSLLYMLEDQGCSCSLSGREGKIFLDAEGEEDRPDKSYPVRAAYSVSGQNVYELISAAADILSRSFPRLKKKSEKRKAEAKHSDFFGLVLEYSLTGCVPALPLSASSSMARYIAFWKKSNGMSPKDNGLPSVAT